jgi:hypothetical protein
MSAPLNLDPIDSRVAVFGLDSLAAGGDGLWTPWRLDPAALRAAFVRPRLIERASVPVGARLAVVTDAEGLHLLLYAPESAAPVDVLVDGTLTARLPIAAGATTVAAKLPGRRALVEVWLPHWGVVRIGPLTLTGATTADAPAVVAPRWIAYGSSITACRASAGPSETWPAEVARREGWELRCLGLDGEAHLDPAVARAIAAMPAQIITLCLGVNVHGHATYSARTLGGAVADFITTVCDGHPDIPIVVITPLFSSQREDQPNAVGLTLSDVRDTVTAATEHRRSRAAADSTCSMA